MIVSKCVDLSEFKEVFVPWNWG